MTLFGLVADTQALPWIATGLVLLVLEVVAPGVFLMWLGLAAIGAGLAGMAVPLGFDLKVVVFAVLAALGIAVALRLRRARGRATVNTPGSGLVGRITEVLGFDGREGRVRLGDSDWPARLAAGAAPPPPGARLRVVDVEGMVLIVAPETAT